MIRISEWLPNPQGVDTKSEWVELSNDGASPISVEGWRLTPDSKKTFTLHGMMGPGEYRVLPRSQTKITLRNTDGKLALYDAAGRLKDHASFLGSAPEGESVIRGTSGVSFGKPTPGAPNAAAETKTLVRDNAYPLNVPLGPSPATAPQFAGSLLGTALALAAAVVFIFKSHESIAHLFFRRN